MLFTLQVLRSQCECVGERMWYTLPCQCVCVCCEFSTCLSLFVPLLLWSSDIV